VDCLLSIDSGRKIPPPPRGNSFFYCCLCASVLKCALHCLQLFWAQNLPLAAYSYAGRPSETSEIDYKKCYLLLHHYYTTVMFFFHSLSHLFTKSLLHYYYIILTTIFMHFQSEKYMYSWLHLSVSVHRCLGFYVIITYYYIFETEQLADVLAKR
jgi:hypothetical protein